MYTYIYILCSQVVRVDFYGPSGSKAFATRTDSATPIRIGQGFPEVLLNLFVSLCSLLQGYLARYDGIPLYLLLLPAFQGC